MSISLLVIVCNDAVRLRSCIASCQLIVDEVIVIVQSSSDDTRDIALSLSTQVIDHPCLGHCEPSREEGIQACTSDYILWLDADEELTEYGQENLKSWLSSNKEMYRLRRLTTVEGNTIEDTHHARLFKRDRVTVSKTLHSEVTPINPHSTEVIDKGVVILHNKTVDEQRADDERYRILSQ